MKHAVSDAAIANATGEPWAVWFDRLCAVKAENMSHKEIVAHLINECSVDGWWAQTLAVRFEQVIGRRVAHQDSRGGFSASVSRTLPGSMDDVLNWWLDKAGAALEFNDVGVVTSSSTHTEKWRYWRAALSDGSRVVVAMYETSSNRSQLSIQHEKLPDQASVTAWQRFWKQYLTT